MKPGKKNYMDQGFALMRDERYKWDFVWLQKVPAGSHRIGQTQARGSICKSRKEAIWSRHVAG
ncbi:hypothetical protein DQG23_36215 [Paenibacillus contaminans]|uniref:Uncharacterized protein n=1 Tax=Paenibacillus contaminans TaxID=450362 RepID=A0A329LU61_9BACL|nr:hypothetical protein DQG23_36215 [Paenibacillus contaminans]